MVAKSSEQKTVVEKAFSKETWWQAWSSWSDTGWGASDQAEGPPRPSKKEAQAFIADKKSSPGVDYYVRKIWPHEPTVKSDW